MSSSLIFMGIGGKGGSNQIAEFLTMGLGFWGELEEAAAVGTGYSRHPVQPSKWLAGEALAMMTPRKIVNPSITSVPDLPKQPTAVPSQALDAPKRKPISPSGKLKSIPKPASPKGQPERAQTLDEQLAAADPDPKSFVRAAKQAFKLSGLSTSDPRAQHILRAASRGEGYQALADLVNDTRIDRQAEERKSLALEARQLEKREAHRSQKEAAIAADQLERDRQAAVEYARESAKAERKQIEVVIADEERARAQRVKLAQRRPEPQPRVKRDIAGARKRARSEDKQARARVKAEEQARAQQVKDAKAQRAKDKRDVEHARRAQEVLAAEEAAAEKQRAKEERKRLAKLRKELKRK